MSAWSYIVSSVGERTAHTQDVVATLHIPEESATRLSPCALGSLPSDSSGYMIHSVHCYRNDWYFTFSQLWLSSEFASPWPSTFRKVWRISEVFSVKVNFIEILWLNLWIILCLPVGRLCEAFRFIYAKYLFLAL